ncbi:MAG: Gfo/Idh/MocA family oxidoreductase [Candidatus Bathyarchaeota archaeon]|nr:Gfo/Idh/MocA family oxidoreductase [Candidatus Bathyarchaeota archaeon]
MPSLDNARVGMIGCGGIAKVHAERLSKLDEVKLAAFADIVSEKAAAFSESYGGEAYTDWHEMLDRERLDIVYVCLPPFSHDDEVMVAAEKGIHIFIEKPIALKVDLARKMVRAVEKSGVKSQVGYNCRFGLAVEEAKRLIESGEAGEIGLALGTYWCHFLGGAWWRNKEKSGGQIVEQSTHLYDAIRYLCGEVDEVCGYMNKKFWTDVPDMTVEDVSSATFRFRSGAVGSIVATTWGVSSQWWLRWMIAARNYTFESRDANSLTLYSTEEPLKTKMISEVRDTYLLEAKDLVQAVLDDNETRTPITEGAGTLEFTLAAMKSMETGRQVKLPL